MSIRTKFHLFIASILPICQGFEGPCFKLGKRRRLNTAYVDDSRNFSHQCESCYKEEVAYWADRWNDIY